MRKHLLTTLLFLITSLSFAQYKAVFDDAILVVLDVQPQFYSDNTEQQAAEMVENINQLVINYPQDRIIYTQASGKILELSLFKITTTEIPPTEMDPQLVVSGNHVFSKTHGNALEEDAIMEHLSSLTQKKLVLTGLMAEECVYQTAIGAIKEGFEVYLVEDAILSTSEDAKDKYLEKMK